MSVINFQVEITPDKKEVALKTMALIATMAEISMRDLASCVEGIEVVDAEEVKGPSGVAAPMKKVEDAEEEKPTKRRKKKSTKAQKKEEEKPEETEEKSTEKKKPYGDDRKDSAVDEYEAKKASEEKPEKKTEKKAEKKAEKKSGDSDITIEQVRAKLQEVVKDHREEIVAKLKELGGTSVSNLPKDKYADMYEFLNSLD